MGTFAAITRLRKFLLVLALLALAQTRGSAQSVTGNCNDLLLKCSINYASSQRQDIVRLLTACEECCLQSHHDSLLVKLYQLDSLSKHFDPCLRKGVATSKSTNPVIIIGDSYTKCAGSYYDSDPGKCLLLLQRGADCYRRAANDAKLATNLQNIAFSHEEKLKQHALSATYLFEALDLWKKLENQLNTANLYKYMGLVQGKMKNFPLAKSYIDSAIVLYQANNFDKGVAVSYFNLALVYREEKMNDSALACLTNARMIWNNYQDTSRLFKINIEAIDIMLEGEQYQNAKEFINENEAYLNNPAIINKDKQDFLLLADKLKRHREGKQTH